MTQLHDARATSRPPAPEVGRSRARSVRRAVYNALGMLCVALGIIGVFVPVWPTTGFVILASILFSRANPKMYAWLLTSRMLGPYLQNWYHKTGIPMSYKIRTCVLLWAGLGVSMVFVSAPWLYALLAVVGIAVTWHVFAIRTRRAGTVATAEKVRHQGLEPRTR